MTVNGGTTYQWYRNGLPISGVVTPNFSTNVAGTYTVLITNSDGCKSFASNSSVLTNGTNPTGIINPSSAKICDGSNVNLSASGGNTYQWFRNGQQISGAFSSNYLASTAGIYTVKLISSNGCSSFASNGTEVTVISKPSVSFNFDTYCINQPIQFTNTTDTSTSSPVAYQWIFGDGKTSSMRNPLHTFTKSGTYIVNLIVTPVSCPNLLGITSKTIIIDPEIKNIRYPTLNAIANQPLQLDARTISDASYNWNPRIGLNSYNISDPIFSYVNELEYNIQINTEAGCIIVDTLKVNMFNNEDIFVPQGFSPNGDGQNDLLAPILVGMRSLTYFKVYNRWGQIVFESRSVNQGWDGRYRGAEQPIESYTWVAEGVGLDGKIIKRSGGAVLLR
jgi:gliding motility-associated-like protein